MFCGNAARIRLPSTYCKMITVTGGNGGGSTSSTSARKSISSSSGGGGGDGTNITNASGTR